jgi:RNA polymerase sigma-70 factor (ECF subfamily)
MRTNPLGTEERHRLAGVPDAEVVQRVRAGDTALFELLMRRHNQRVYRAIRSVLRDDAEAEDAVQQAWLAAYAHLDEFEGSSAFSTWLTRIALNEAFQRLRRRARLVTVPEAPDHEVADMRTTPVDPEARTAGRELARMLEQAVDGLPDIHRSAFVLREVEGMSTAEAAACLGVSEDVVKVRLHRAKQALRDALYERAGGAASEVFPFMGERCDRVVAAVMAALPGGPGDAA